MPEDCLTDDQLQAWLDGELAASLGARADAHVPQCPDCSERARQYRRLFASLEQAADRMPAFDLAPSVLARIEPGARTGVWGPRLLAGQLLLGAVVLALSWSRVGSLLGHWLPRIVPSLAVPANVETAVRAARLLLTGIQWGALVHVAEIPATWLPSSWSTPWPSWGALLAVSALLWTGVNGWLLRQTRARPIGLSGR